MATTRAVARNLLKNSKSLAQVIRGQILGRSNVFANPNMITNDHQIVQSLFISNPNMHPQIPIFDFSKMGSLLGSSKRLSVVKEGVAYGKTDSVVEAGGKRVVEGEDDDDNPSDESEDDDEYHHVFEDDDDDSEDDWDEDEEDDGDNGDDGNWYK